MAFLKFHDERESNGKRLFWHRASLDGAPFRGNQIPLLKEHEFEEKVERVWDCHHATFDTSNPGETHHGRTLTWILDAAVTGWVQILFREHTWVESEDGGKKMLQYIEWAEPYSEMPRGVGATL